jgi:hypothetical protein
MTIHHMGASRGDMVCSQTPTAIPARGPARGTSPHLEWHVDSGWEVHIVVHARFTFDLAQLGLRILP